MLVKSGIIYTDDSSCTPRWYLSGGEMRRVMFRFSLTTGSNIGIIIGAVIGGVVILVLLILVICCGK